MSKPKNMKSIYWSLFAAGGMIAALVLPTLVAILSLLLPMELVGNPATFYDTVSPLFSQCVFLHLDGRRIVPHAVAYRAPFLLCTA